MKGAGAGQVLGLAPNERLGRPMVAGMKETRRRQRETARAAQANGEFKHDTATGS